MTDIASLAFSIDTSDVSKAETALDGLNTAGAKTEASAKSVSNAWSGAAAKVGSSSSGFKQGTDRIKEQQTELGKLLGQINPVVAALDRLDEQERKLGQFKSGGLVDLDTFREYKARIDASRASLTGFETDVRKAGASSKQTSAALRQLPAQFSDIAISLQGGQNPLSVFLQQGSQIKDSFGGVGPALRETARYALGLVNPFTLGAAAVAALTVAYVQGSNEAVAYNKALILTGNSAGLTASALSSMAAAQDQVNGTQSQAAEVLTEVASAGKFTADQIQGIAASAIAMEEATGKAINDTVNEFKRLADEPAAASAKLNEQYNYLTASVYEQIRALEDQGDAAGAAQLAIETFGTSMTQRASEIEESLGLIERGWKGIKNTAAEAWDAMLDIGRPDTLEDRLDDVQGKLERASAEQQRPTMSRFGNFNGGQSANTTDNLRGQLQGILQDEVDQVAKARQEMFDASNQQAGIEAFKGLQDGLDKAKSKSEQLGDALKKIDKQVIDARKAGLTVDEADIAKLRAAANEQFKEKAPRAAKAAKEPVVRDDAATKLLITLREQQATLEQQLATEGNLTDAQKKRAAFESQINDLKTKGVLTAEQQSLLNNQDAIKAQLDKNVAIAEEVRLHNESLKLQERSEQIQASIQSSAEGRQQQQQRSLDAFGQGREQQERAESAASIFREFRRYQDQLNKNTPKDLLGGEQYNEQREKIGQGLRDALAQHEAYYDRLEELQGSWQVGASQAFADYAEEAGDIAGQTADLIGGTLESLTQGIGDSFAEAVVSGENLQESMQNLASTILTDVLSSLVQVGVRYGVNAALEMAGITAVTGAKVAAATTVATAETAAIATTATAAAAATASTTATQVAAAATTTTAWAPAATVASIGSFGSAAAIGIAAVIAALALSKGFKTGGYTGAGDPNGVAGVVHNGEYVMTAEQTKRIGVGNLEALSAGRSIATGSAKQAQASASGGQQNVNYITVNQPNVTNAREARASNQQTRKDLGRAIAGVQRAS